MPGTHAILACAFIAGSKHSVTSTPGSKCWEAEIKELARNAVAFADACLTYMPDSQPVLNPEMEEAVREIAAEEAQKARLISPLPTAGGNGDVR